MKEKKRRDREGTFQVFQQDKAKKAAWHVQLSESQQNKFIANKNRV